MNILEKIQDILYDIFGMLIPGVTALVLMIVYGDVYLKTKSLELTFVNWYDNLDKFKEIGKIIENHSGFNLVNIIIGFTVSYLIGCGLLQIRKKIYGFLNIKDDEYYKIEFNCKNLLEKLIDKNDFLVFTCSQDKKKIENIEGEANIEVEQNGLTFCRKLLSKNGETTMISKYIGKHNFFFSMEVIWCFLVQIHFYIMIVSNGPSNINLGIVKIVVVLILITVWGALTKFNFIYMLMIIQSIVFFLNGSNYLIALLYCLLWFASVFEGNRHQNLSNEEHEFELIYKLLEKEKKINTNNSINIKMR